MGLNKQNSIESHARRAFFKQLALLGGVLALRPISGAAAKPLKAENSVENGYAGYRLTDHIRRYYNRASE